MHKTLNSKKTVRSCVGSFLQELGLWIFWRWESLCSEQVVESLYSARCQSAFPSIGDLECKENPMLCSLRLPVSWASLINRNSSGGNDWESQAGPGDVPATGPCPLRSLGVWVSVACVWACFHLSVVFEPYPGGLSVGLHSGRTPGGALWTILIARLEPQSLKFKASAVILWGFSAPQDLMCTQREPKANRSDVGRDAVGTFYPRSLLHEMDECKLVEEADVSWLTIWL